MATADAAKGLTAGVHGTTFGGNPLAMAIGNAVLDIVLAPGFIENVARLGLLARQQLAELKDRHPQVIEEVRGEGLMIGLKLKVPAAGFAALARNHRLLTIPAGDAVVRLLPPLVISDDELSEGVRRLHAACADAEAGSSSEPKVAAAGPRPTAAPPAISSTCSTCRRRRCGASSTRRPP
jgi:acetylornithine/N-succinyldiaminopimelate aminotransferase